MSSSARNTINTAQILALGSRWQKRMITADMIRNPHNV